MIRIPERPWRVTLVAPDQGSRPLSRVRIARCSFDDKLYDKIHFEIHSPITQTENEMENR